MCGRRSFPLGLPVVSGGGAGRRPRSCVSLALRVGLWNSDSAGLGAMGSVLLTSLFKAL